MTGQVQGPDNTAFSILDAFRVAGGRAGNVVTAAFTCVRGLEEPAGQQLVACLPSKSDLLHTRAFLYETAHLLNPHECTLQQVYHT